MAMFELELVSPEKLLLSRTVEMVIIPAVEGDMGVLGGHAPMIVALKGGVISVRENGQETERMFVRGGFANIGPSRVTILADDARPVAEISRAEAERLIVEAERDYLAAADDTPEKRDAAMDRLLAMRVMKEAAQAA